MMAAVALAVSNGLVSCKATRTITTTSTCTICNDSTKAEATIQTRTVENYTGVKKN